MAIRKIARMGHPVLLEVAEAIEDPTTAEIARLAADLIDTCEDIGGNGIAAPQVYEPLRMFVYRVRVEVMPAAAQMHAIPWTVCINPQIDFLNDSEKLYWERCLSLPGLYGQVSRFTDIHFHWTDLHGARHSIATSGFHARLLQHEYDHLDGRLYPTRMVDVATLGYVSELAPAQYPALPNDARDFVDPKPI